MAVAIHHDIGRPRFLLVALRRSCSLGLLVASFVYDLSSARCSLMFCRLLSVEARPWIAVTAEVVKVLSRGGLTIARIVAFDVLPRVALLAVYCIAIVVCKVADALDCVWLFIDRFGHRSIGGRRKGVGCSIGRRRDRRWV